MTRRRIHSQDLFMLAITSQDVYVQTSQGRLFARRWDPAGEGVTGAPIVLFHDSLGCVELWRDFPEQLAQETGRSVIAYDRLGFGRSDPNTAVFEPGFVAEEAQGGFRSLREELGIGPFVGFGHSVGGGMAVCSAGVYADDCQALITESAQMYAEDRTLQGIRAAKLNFAEPGQLDRLKKYHGEKAAWVLGAWIDTWLAPEFADWNLDEQLRQVRCPVLALHGEEDEYGSPLHQDKIVALAGGRAVLLENCGHVPHREQSRIVLDVVGQWLKTVR